MPKDIPVAISNFLNYIGGREEDLVLSDEFFYLKDEKENLYRENDARKYMSSIRNEIESIDFFQEDSYFIITYNRLQKDYVMKLRFCESDLIDSISIEEYDSLKRQCVLEIEYDGTNYFGMQKQPTIDGKTIQGEIELALRRMLKRNVKTTISSRTDRGVHAMSNRIQFDSLGIEPKRYMYALNNLLPDDIRIRNAELKSQLHNCRYDVISKEYEYIVDTNEYSVFKKNYCLFHSIKDEDGIRRELGYLIGTHDFNSFCKGENGDTVRTILDASYKKNEGVYTFTFKGDGFLHNMIRLIMGTILYIDEGADLSIKDVMESKNKNLTQRMAPSSGLYLKKINYRRTFK